jgi:hypothetical protein
VTTPRSTASAAAGTGAWGVGGGPSVSVETPLSGVGGGGTLSPLAAARESPTGSSGAVTPTRRAPKGLASVSRLLGGGGNTRGRSPGGHSPAAPASSSADDTTSVAAPPTTYLHDAVWSDGGDGSGANLLGVVWMATRKRLQKVVLEEEELVRRQKWLEKRPTSSRHSYARPLLPPSSGSTATEAVMRGAGRTTSNNRSGSGYRVGDVGVTAQPPRPIAMVPRPPPVPQASPRR